MAKVFGNELPNLLLNRRRIRTVILITLAVLLTLPVLRILLPSKIPKRRRITPALNEVWMSREESKSFLRYGSGVRTYLEWGSGGSTLNIAPMATDRAVAIEHDKRWCTKMKRELSVRNFSHIEFYCVPRDRTTGTDGTYAEFRPYIDKIDELNQRTWDFILIDGRARVVAAIKALSYLSPKSIVALHDFCRISYHIVGPNNYSPVLYFYDIVHYIPTGQGIAFLRRKPQFNYMEGNHLSTKALLETGNGLFTLRMKSQNVQVSKSCTF